MEVYTSDSSDTDSREQKTLNFSRMNLLEVTLEDDLRSETKKKLKIQKDFETMLLNHNRLTIIPPTIKLFVNLKILDLSSNNLTQLPESLNTLPLVTLIAKNNLLTNKSLPKSLVSKNSSLKELNLSGNLLTHFPDQILELRHLRYLYAGGNKISSISKDIWKMHSGGVGYPGGYNSGYYSPYTLPRVAGLGSISGYNNPAYYNSGYNAGYNGGYARFSGGYPSGLQVLSLGGNLINDVPDTVGCLSQLQALVLCENSIENLPTSIARLKNLKSLLLHKNRLRHLPKDIVALKNLTELSLRDNPLVVRFVQDMALNPPTLMELAARAVKSTTIKYGAEDLPFTLLDYLSSANCCVNPNCKGVFFDNRVEHIKFVDFCGKYRVPLLQYLCSSKCIQSETQQRPEPGASGYLMRKVLLG